MIIKLNMIEKLLDEVYEARMLGKSVERLWERLRFLKRQQFSAQYDYEMTLL